jgi:hypothetical protein
MSKRFNVFCVAVLCMIALGPASFMPRLSAHAPAFTADTPAAPVSHGPGSLQLLSPMAAMGIKVKDIGTVAAKFKTRAQAAQADYAKGVEGAAGEWEAKSAAAEDVYKAAVVDAASKGRYGAGVRGSAGKYQKNATTLGPQRYQQGIGNAQDAYAQAMAPVLQTIAGLNLPPRALKGQNQERSNIVAMALRKMKVGA